jgi:putative pyruvate formate lyase activating enzyme
MNTTETHDSLRSHLTSCLLCPRQCGVNRSIGEHGYCQAGQRLRVASHCLHKGEEPPISGSLGSGTIFFAHCSMACAYCQNYPISQLGHGNDIGVDNLTEMMLRLERMGAHNINLVTPAHFLPHIVEALTDARRRNLRVPIVYNSSGYERPETIRMLEGLIQVYLVDMRYSRAESGVRYSDAPDYPFFNRRAIQEMIRQVGPLACRGGLAVQGVVIRHLLIPTLISETREILRYISTRIGREVPVSLMSQYFPTNRAHSYPEINRRVNETEYSEAISLLDRYDLAEGWVQEPGTSARPVI